MCGGNNVPPPPPLDPAAVALEQEQLKLLQGQAEQQTAFAPLQAEAAGYAINPAYAAAKTQMDALAKSKDEWLNNPSPTGENRSFSDTERKQAADSLQSQIDALSKSTPMYQKTAAKTTQDAQLADLQTQQMATAQKANDALSKYLDSLNTDDYKAYQKAQQDLQAQQTQIALQQGERTQKALAGELPVSQGTIDRKAADFQLLKENLARTGNAIIGDDPASAYSLSSPGVQALKQFNQQYGTIEAQERQGQIDTGTQGYISAVGLSGSLGQTALNTTGQLSNPGGYASTSTSLNPGNTPVQNNLSLVQGYSSALNPYLQQQQLANQNNTTNAQIASQNQAGWLQLGGTVVGTAAGAYAASNRRFKKNIEPIKSERDATKALAGTPVYRWNYKNEPDGHKKHLGTMTDEAPEDVVTQDGDFLDITSYLGLLTLSAKDLHGRVLSLEGSR